MIERPTSPAFDTLGQGSVYRTDARNIFLRQFDVAVSHVRRSFESDCIRISIAKTGAEARRTVHGGLTIYLSFGTHCLSSLYITIWLKNGIWAGCASCFEGLSEYWLGQTKNSAWLGST